MPKNRKDNIEFLTKGIRAVSVKDFDLQLAERHNLTPKLLLQYSLSDDPLVSFRAGWLLEHIIIKQPSIIPTIYVQYIDTMENQRNWSAIRSLTKIAMLASKGKYVISHTQVQRERLIEVCFSWVIDPKCPVAVTVNCLDIIANFSDSAAWIKDELRAQIDYLLVNATPSLVARSKRILKRIG
ncbi:hypothetical protein HP439_05055 [Sphingobacterium shayense]|uniref:hypothetical protein n=1 Tax=Sphingobacterium shayense TaxID=626343 RepID=UPI0015536F3F|nr:hypothetical protein [Sphingobacterium shayense]NQD70086.1 hypothetical protein [Sphingobacterium shayense]